MVIGRIGQIQMVVHPAMPVVMAALSFTHGIASVGVMMIVLASHEAAHAMCARALGVHVEQIEWMPFGGAVRLEGFSALTGWRGALIAAAGPLVNLLTIMGCATCVQYNLCSVEQLRGFVQCSAMLMIVNMLPVLPMDGGRILCALLSYFMRESLCRRVLCILGGIMSLSMMGAGVWVIWKYRKVNMTFFLMGSYLLYATVNEYRVPWYRQFENVTGKMRRVIRESRTLRVREIIATEFMPVCRLAATISPTEWYRVRIVDDQGNMVGMLDEMELVQAMLRNPAQTIKEVLEAGCKS